MAYTRNGSPSKRRPPSRGRSSTPSCNVPTSPSFAECVYCGMVPELPKHLRCGHLICARHLVSLVPKATEAAATMEALELPAYEASATATTHQDASPSETPVTPSNQGQWQRLLDVLVADMYGLQAQLPANLCPADTTKAARHRHIPDPTPLHHLHLVNLSQLLGSSSLTVSDHATIGFASRAYPDTRPVASLEPAPGTTTPVGSPALAQSIISKLYASLLVLLSADTVI